MYRGGQGGSHGRSSKGHEGGGRARDYGHGESRRRRSRSRSRERRQRSRSGSSSRDSGNGYRERRRHGNRGRESSSSSSSSSPHHSLERPSFATTSAVNAANVTNVVVEDRSFENKYNAAYKPPSGIFEDIELQTRYSSGVNMEAPSMSRIDTLADSSEIGINPSTGNWESQLHYYGTSQTTPSGGISMKLQTVPKEPPGVSLPRVVAPISAKVVAPKPGSIYSRPTKLVSPVVPTLPSKSAKIASVFNVDDDDEPEEMPPECKMRMKNVGRDTPTSAGPNSFGKTKIGFCNVTHIAEKKLEGTLAPTKKK